MDKLEAMFTNLIAEQDGVKPEEVTVAYIHEQREKRIYSHMRKDWERFEKITGLLLKYSS